MSAPDARFTTIRSEGGLLPPDLLARIGERTGGQELPGQAPEEYGLAKGDRLDDAIARAWNACNTHWDAWQSSLAEPGGSSITELREQWLLPLFRNLGYGRLVFHQAAEQVGERRFVISHRAGEGDSAPPIHTVPPEPETTGSPLPRIGRGAGGEGHTAWLDRAARPDDAGPRRSPHGLLQEYLNLTGHLWGIVTDGRRLRLLRDNAALSRAAYVEIDLEAMFTEGVYADFVLLYLLLHRSRLPHAGAPVEECWLEQWRRAGEASGARARDALRLGVEAAIVALGQGLLESDDPANQELRERLASEQLTVQSFYRQLLRTVYRLLFLLAAEERDLLFAPGASAQQRSIYRDYYGINRLRDLARRPSSDRHDDLWQGVQVLFRALRDEEQAHLLGLAPLGGLFDEAEMGDLDGWALADATTGQHRHEPSPPAPLPVRGRGEPSGEPVGEPGTATPMLARIPGAESPSPAHRERGWGEGSSAPSTPEPSPLSRAPGEGLGVRVASGEGPGVRAALGEGSSPHIPNHCLLTALRGLGWITAGTVMRRINYRDMDVEELGSVYEGLLEQQPALRREGERVEFTLDRSGERKTTGSYYTNPGLVRELIRSALEPAIAAARAQGATPVQQRQALLALTVCDPACGSGHFLLAAARRIGRALAEVEAGADEPSPAVERAAVREAVGQCVFGVDLNPLAVDLCKVALWLEGQHAGKPLQFLDHHIRHGNALIGATAAVMAEGIPDAAFDAVTGDSKAYASTIKKRNREERKGQMSLLEAGWQVTEVSDAAQRARYWATQEDTLAAERRRADNFARHHASPAFQRRILAADLWTAAFFWPLQTWEPNPPTQAIWRNLAASEDLAALASGEPQTGDARTVHLARTLARRHDFFHWELEFEEVFDRADPGFGVILGNPPWGQIESDPQVFFAQTAPEIASAPNFAKRKKMIEGLEQSNPELFRAHLGQVRSVDGLQKFIHDCGRFPLSSVGRLNTAPVFTELAVKLIRTTGNAGVIVPSGIATDSFTQGFFRWLVDNRRLVSLFDFENSEGLFPNVHRSYKFSLLTSGQSRHPDGAFDAAFFLTQPTQLEDPQRAFALSPEEIALLNPNTRTTPIFRSRRDAEITKHLYRQAPVLVKEGQDGEDDVNPWGVRFKLMFMMNSGLHLFRTREELEGSGHELGADGRFRGPGGTWERLYEAKMIHQYDHRFATYPQDGAASDKARDTTLAEHQDPDYVVLGRYWVHEDEVKRAAGDTNGREWFLGFRDIARATDERTAIVSVVPWAAVGHSLPLVSVQAPSRQYCGLLGNFNSLIFDYVVRQKVGGTHLTFFIIRQLPFLAPLPDKSAQLDLIARRVVALSFTSDDLAPFASSVGYDGPACVWNRDQRALGIAELDGIYAHLYNLSREDFAYILDQFPIVKRRDIAAHGEYRTARLCLEAYDYYAREARVKLRTAMEDVEMALRDAIVTRLGNDLGRVSPELQAKQVPEREKQRKAPYAASLADFLGAGYLPLLDRVMRQNREPAFADWFASNSEVERHVSGLVGLRNELAHPDEQFLPDKVRTAGERELRWFGEKLGLAIDIVPPPAIEPPVS